MMQDQDGARALGAEFTPAGSIDEVIERLGAIVAMARERGERLGLFASLYRRTTIRVRTGLGDGRFEDAERMERLDVLFANRYLHAYEQYRADRLPPESWRLAFARAAEPDHLVLQHLMLGMNAHINLDLGIAACATCPGPALADLERDFFEINQLLAEMIDVVQEDLASVSPLLGWLDRLGGRADELLVRNFLARSRASAWERARRLAALEGEAHDAAVARYDRFTARLGRRLCPPVATQPAWLRVVRRREATDLEAIYDVLE